MKVSLIDYTGAGIDDHGRHAANVLVFTKSTRLTMSPGLFDLIASKPWDEILKELEYMANTIPSSWEFCHYTFMIEGVTRGFTHQFVRTRTASFAQQTMRILDVDGWEYGTGPTIKSDGQKQTYDMTMARIAEAYKELIKMGVKIEDARGILPTNILTNICVSMNLRTLVEMVQKRSSPRVQGEYRQVLDQMKHAVVNAHPWATLFIDRDFQRAAKDLDDEIEALPVEPETATRMKKLVDQLRQKGV